MQLHKPHYNMTESCALLGCDRVTLRRWLAAEGMTKVSDPRDKRFRDLSREQVQHLATVHGRELREEPEPVRAPGVQRQLVVRLERLEKEERALREEQREFLDGLDRAVGVIHELRVQLDSAEKEKRALRAQVARLTLELARRWKR